MGFRCIWALLVAARSSRLRSTGLSKQEPSDRLVMSAMGTELDDQKISLFADPPRETRIQIGKEKLLLGFFLEIISPLN